MSDEALIERMVVAMATVREQNGGAPYTAYDAVFGKRAADKLRENLREEARAALSALQRDLPREMTDAMMDAGQRYLDSKTLGLSGRFTLPGTFNWHEFWQTILDAQIAEKCGGE